jgi:hypothetical protein
MRHEIFFAALLAATPCMAQDTHYWSQPFGTRSALLGGAVVGGDEDNTAVYYNPGALGFMDTGSISVSGNLYRIQKFHIQNALGNNADFKDMNLGSVPLLVAGMFRTRNQRLRLGYGILQPVDFNFKGAARLDGNYDLVPDPESPGPEAVIAQKNVTSDLHEIMVVFTPSWRLGEHWAIGLGNFFTGRSQNYTNAVLVRGYLNDAAQTLVTADEIQHFNYFHLRYVAKLGVSWKGKNVSFGATVSTPGLRLAGTGTIGADYTGTNILWNGVRQNILADGLQPKLKTQFRSPYNVSAGVNWKFAKSMLGLAGQYYGKEGVYDILRAGDVPFVRPVGAYPELGASDFLRVQSAAREVVNATIGYEQQLSSTITLQASFRNDMTYYDKDLDQVKGIHPDITTWNIYTFSAGVAISSGRSLVTVGLTGSSGADNNHAESGTITGPSNDQLLRGAVTVTKATYSSFGFLLGFKYRFKKI